MDGRVDEFSISARWTEYIYFLWASRPIHCFHYKFQFKSQTHNFLSSVVTEFTALTSNRESTAQQPSKVHNAPRQRWCHHQIAKILTSFQYNSRAPRHTYSMNGAFVSPGEIILGHGEYWDIESRFRPLSNGSFGTDSFQVRLLILSPNDSSQSGKGREMALYGITRCNVITYFGVVDRNLPGQLIDLE